MTYLPTTGAQWWALACFEAGGFLGWLLHPLLWVVAGPFRWASLLAMTAAQESGFTATASGDDGNSIGIAQFNVKSWPDLTGRELSDRESPFISGFYSARYIHLALLASWKWWAIALPYYGPPMMRWAWTHGISASSAESGGTDGAALAAYKSEGRAGGAYMVFRAISLLPAIISAMALYALAARMVRTGFRSRALAK